MVELIEFYKNSLSVCTCTRTYISWLFFLLVEKKCRKMIDFCSVIVWVSAHVSYYIAARSFAMPFIFPHYGITHETNYVHLCVLLSITYSQHHLDALPCLQSVSTAAAVARGPTSSGFVKWGSPARAAVPKLSNNSIRRHCTIAPECCTYIISDGGGFKWSEDGAE